MGLAIGTLFKELSTAPFPMRMFEKEEDARSWLKECILK
jgi:hypothetical protein